MCLRANIDMHHITSKLFRLGFTAAAIVLQFALFCTGALADPVVSPAQDGYNPNVDGLVYCSVMQPDGSLVIGGKFTRVQGQARTSLARIKVDGSLDESFNLSVQKLAGGSTDAGASVTALALQANGNLILGGDFDTVGGAAHTHLARSSGTGVVDSSFTPTVNQLLVPSTFRLKALTVQRDGKILVGGHFDSFQLQGAAADTRVVKSNLLRLNTDGTLDTSLTVSTSDLVNAILIRPDNSIIVGGGFATISQGPFASSDHLAIPRLARIKANGELDTTFVPTPNNRVNALVNAQDGDLYIGGLFTTLKPLDLSAARPVNCLARLNANGTLDADFSTSANGEVWSLALQPDGALLVGGNFSELVYAKSGSYSTTATSYVGRVKANGYPDKALYTYLNEVVSTIAVQSDGNILLGGYFTRVSVAGDSLSTPRNHLLRVYPDGTPDTDFTSVASGAYSGALPLANGKIFLFGSFSEIGGYTSKGLSLINADGTLDSSFQSRVTGTVNSAVEVDGKYIVVGNFTKINGIAAKYIARLNADGSLDTSFTNAEFNSSLNLVVVQPDKKLLVTGGFTGIGSETLHYMARLNADGSHDTTFVPNPSKPPVALHVYSDGKILAGGEFTFFNPNAGATQYAYYIARLKADGTLDTTFVSTVAVNSSVNCFEVQSDGKIYVGGNFQGYSLPDTTDSTITNTYSGVVRLSAEGALDEAFLVTTDGGVRSLLVQAGKVYLAGTFTTVNDTERYFMAAVDDKGVVDSTFNPSPDGYATHLINAGVSNRLMTLGRFVSFSPNGATEPTFSPALAWINTTDGSIDNTRTPKATAALAAAGKINFVIHQTDSSLIVGGSFSGLKGAVNPNLTRLSAAGRGDTGFKASPDGEVSAGVALPVEFEELSNNVGLNWLSSDISKLYAPLSTLPYIEGTVYCAATQADGDILIGGSFTVKGDTTNMHNLARLKRDPSSPLKYSIDTNFSVAVGGVVRTIVVDSYNHIYIGGSFTSLQGNSDYSYCAMLEEGGTINAAFRPRFNDSVDELEFTADKKALYVAGAYTQAYGTSDTVSSQYYLTKLSLVADANGKTGAIDSTFNSTPSGEVYTIEVQSDGKLVVGGTFTYFYDSATSTSTVRRYIARVNTDGTLDANFNPLATSNVVTLKLDADEKILVGGQFSGFTPNEPDATELTVKRPYFARLNSDGTVDSLDMAVDSSVTEIGLQSNGDIVIGGLFSQVKGEDRATVAQFSSTGVLGGIADIVPASTPSLIFVTADDSLILGGSFYQSHLKPAFVIGGDFNNIGTYSAPKLARLYIDGGLDRSFKVVPNGKVWALLREPTSGKIIVGGDFTKLDVTIDGNTTSTDVSYIARLNEDGSLDNTFVAQSSAPVRTLTLVPSGSILVGTNAGALNLYSASGVLDGSFSVSLGSGSVNAVTLSSEGVLLVGTSQAPFFTASVQTNLLPSASRPSSTPSLPTVGALDGAVNSIVVSSDGVITLGGAFTKLGDFDAPGFVRFSNSGVIDTSLVPASINGPVTSLMLTEEGKTIIGGSFSTVDSLDRFMLCRLAPYSSAQQSLSYSEANQTLTWKRSGSLPVLSRAYFEYTTDNGETWTAFTGDLPFKGNGWVHTFASPIDLSGVFIRARGELQSAPYGSAGIVALTTGGSDSVLSEIGSLDPLNPAAGQAISVSLGDKVSSIPTSVTGLPAGLSYDPLTGIISGSVSTSGSYKVSINWFDGVNNQSADLIINVASLIANMSLNVSLPVDGMVTPGFVIGGTSPKQILIRVIGPGLNGFGLTGIGNPTFTLTCTAGADQGVLHENVGSWGNDASVAAAASRVGGFALAANSADCAKLLSLKPGNYTVTARDLNGQAGSVLVEVYDASQSLSNETDGLVNVSGNMAIVDSANPIIAGLVLHNGPQRVLVRAVGPSLAAFGLNGHSNPRLEVYNSSGVLIASNDDWATVAPIEGSLIVPLSAEAAKAASTQVYAFDLLESDTSSAVLLLDLPAGLYTAQAKGADGSSLGTTLLEVYQVK